MNNPFILAPDEYKREINPLKQYVDQAAHFLSTKYNKPFEDCIQWVKENIAFENNNPENKPLTMKNPIVTFIGKDNNGDRELQQIPLSAYINSSLKNKELIAPTFTTYMNPEEKESHLVDFIDSMVAERNKAKKAMFQAELRMVEQPEYQIEYSVQSNKQANAKIMNNSLSGAGVVASTPLYNKTMHSTLTSTCRSASGYANANNEKLLTGNRHYHRPDIVINNIVSIISNVDYDKIKAVIDRHQIVVPGPHEVMEVILRSSRQYWRNIEQEEKIRDFVLTLNELQRAAFLYVGDIFTLAQFNRPFVETMIKKLGKKMPLDTSLNTKEIIEGVEEDIANLAIQICRKEMKGLELKQVYDTEATYLVANTVLNIVEGIEYYSDYIEAFLRTKNVPASLSYFPSSIRHSALMSDTDSTIFTVEYWNNWMFGELKFDDEANQVFAVMVFFSVSTLKHLLALMSANFGIGAKRIHQIAMKNEFKFDVFVPTLKTKHYYAIISYQEGKVWSKFKQEIKGVHLKSSNAPPVINKEASEIMEDICVSIEKGDKINLLAILKRMADRERDIIRSVQAGESLYYRGGQIKSAQSYRGNEEESMYRHYTFWNETFGHKYGMAPPPPYSFIKMTTKLETKTALKNWLDNMEDKELSRRLQTYFNKRQKDKQVSFYVPSELFVNQKLPIELTEQVDIRSLIADICHNFYFILETLGVFRLNKNQTRLISDEI